MGFSAGCQNRNGKPVPSTAHFDFGCTSHSMPEDHRSFPRIYARSHSSTSGGTHVICTMAGMLALAAAPGWAGAQPPEPAGQLIRETIYNELQDHNSHGFWRYWIQQRVQNDTRLAVQVETADGPVSRLVQTNGHPIDDQTREEERARFERLVNSPQEQASHR